jgi:hypothetical protein
MDPVTFRLGMLDGAPRLKAALQLVTEKSDWGQPLPARVGRGPRARGTVRFGPCVDGSELARAFFTFAELVASRRLWVSVSWLA